MKFSTVSYSSFKEPRPVRSFLLSDKIKTEFNLKFEATESIISKKVKFLEGFSK